MWKIRIWMDAWIFRSVLKDMQTFTTLMFAVFIIFVISAMSAWQSWYFENRIAEYERKERIQHVRDCLQAP